MFHYSSSGAALRKIEQIKDYLLSDGTCKCGLPCPFRPEHFFEFNPQVSERQKSLNHSFRSTKKRKNKKIGAVDHLNMLNLNWNDSKTHSLIFEWGIPKLNGFTILWVCGIR